MSNYAFVNPDEITRLARRLVQVLGHLECSNGERELARFLAGFLESEKPYVHQRVRTSKEVGPVLKGTGGGGAVMPNADMDAVSP